MRLVYSFFYAFKGIVLMLSSEINALIHCLATAAVVGLGIRFNITSLEWVMLAICIGMVWMAELFNTAIERIMDMVHPDFSVDVGRIKDMAAGGVLVVAIIAMVCGVIIFTPYITST